MPRSMYHGAEAESRRGAFVLKMCPVSIAFTYHCSRNASIKYRGFFAVITLPN
jgi:hypothetical protein